MPRAAAWNPPCRARALLAAGLACLPLASLAAEPFSAGLLFRVAKPGVPPSFVFGTVHVADPRVLELAPPVAQAFRASRAFAAELALDALIDPRLADAEALPAGGSLATLVGEPAFGRIAAQLVAQGVPAAAVDRMKPWAALVRVSRVDVPPDAATLDQKLLAMARARRLPVVPLEWADEQIAAFDTVPVETQVALLRHAVIDRDALGATSQATVEAWLRRDLAAIARAGERIGARYPHVARHYRVLEKHIVANRTLLMHHRLILPLREGGLFVAVGASHLPGDKGLLRLLAKDGYTVTREW
ncbi:MAG: TraB/GumN family protein [Burkholderiales bacterium]|nr:TraB/GumN family protein [Burkholderiales bacterium]